MSWALKGSRFASSQPAGIEMMKGWTCESPNAGTSREADGDETGGEERQEYQAEGRGRGPAWERTGSLRVLELDPVVRTVLRKVLLNTLCKVVGERSHHLKGTQRQSGHPREAGEGLDSMDVRRQRPGKPRDERGREKEQRRMTRRTRVGG